MDDFGKTLLRLKEQLGVQTDREVGALLGLSATAFNSRKQRGAFPEDKLFALKAKRPDLPLDTTYVLTGVRSSELGADGAQLEHAHKFQGTRRGKAVERDAHYLAEATREHAASAIGRKPYYARLESLLNRCEESTVRLVVELVEKVARGEQSK